MNDGAGRAAPPGATAGSGRPRLPAALAADLNLIYDRGAGVGQRALDLALELSFTPDLPPGPPALNLALVVDGVALTVGLDDFFIARALEPLLPDAALASAPPALRAAASEVALAELAQAFNVEAQLSFEGLMRCGIGLCGSCELAEEVCQAVGLPQGWLVCRDGPVAVLPARA